MTAPPTPDQRARTELHNLTQFGSILTAIGAFLLTVGCFEGIYGALGPAIAFVAIGIIGFVPGVGILLFTSLLPILARRDPAPPNPPTL